MQHSYSASMVWGPRTLLFCCFAVFNLRWLLLLLLPPCYHGIIKRETRRGGHFPFQGTVWKFIIFTHIPFIRTSHMVTLSCKEWWKTYLFKATLDSVIMGFSISKEERKKGRIDKREEEQAASQGH